MSCIPGYFPFGAAAGLGPFSATRTDNQLFAPNDTISQFSGSVNIGAAAGNRRVVVVIAIWENFDNVSAVTIGGVPATIHSQGQLGDSWSVVASAVVPTGTTANVVVTLPFTEFITNVLCTPYRLVNAINATPNGTIFVDPSARVASGTINIPDGGCLIAFATHFAGSGGTRQFNWVGATEFYDAQLSTVWTASAAFEPSLPAQTGRTVSATFTGTGSSPVTGLVAVSWR